MHCRQHTEQHYDKTRIQLSTTCQAISDLASYVLPYVDQLPGDASPEIANGVSMK